MTDYKTAYETLAAAARAYYARSQELDDDLARVLDQAPAAASQEPCPSCGSVGWSYGEGQHCDDCPSPAVHEVPVPPLRTATQVLADPPVLGLLPHDENYWLHMARREGDSEVGAGARPPVLQVTDGHGNPDPDGKYWTVAPDPDAAEREHCEREAVALLRQTGAQLAFGSRPVNTQLSLITDLLIRERADAAKRATEAERQRVLAIEPIGSDGEYEDASMDVWRERIASGEKP